LPIERIAVSTQLLAFAHLQHRRDIRVIAVVPQLTFSASGFVRSILIACMGSVPVRTFVSLAARTFTNVEPKEH